MLAQEGVLELEVYEGDDGRGCGALWVRWVDEG